MNSQDRRLSIFQLGTLKYIADHIINVENVRIINQVTFWSLWHRNYLTRNGNKIELTRLGEEVLKEWLQMKPSYRSNPKLDISERVAGLISLKQIRVLKSA